MVLSFLHQRYENFAILSDEVHLFWTLSSSSSSSQNNSILSDRSNESDETDANAMQGNETTDENLAESFDVVGNDTLNATTNSNWKFQSPEEKDKLFVPDMIEFAIAYLLPKLPQSLNEQLDDPSKTATKSNTLGNYWLGFGLSPQGGMIGADMMIYLPDQEPMLLDVYGVEYSYPKVDDCGQDWHFVNSSVIGIAPSTTSTTHSSMNSTDKSDDLRSNDYFEGNTSDGDVEAAILAWHIVEATRSLQSNDINEDLPFIDDSSTIVNPTRVLAAWGIFNLEGDKSENDGRHLDSKHNTGETRSLGSVMSQNEDEQKDESNELVILDLTAKMMPHGPTNRVSGSVRFFSTTKAEKNEIDTDQINNKDDAIHEDLEHYPYIDLIPNQPFQIPNVETTYKNFCYQIEDYPELMEVLAENGGVVHIVGFREILGGLDDNEGADITKGMASSIGGSLVHHMDLHGTTNNILGADKRLCRTYLDLIHPWEAGSPTTFTLPKEAGIPLGVGLEDSNDGNYDEINSGENSMGYRAFRVEVHYHNPRLQSGRLDRSGVRLYYSPEKRQHVAGLMLLGDYMLKLRGSFTVGSSRKNYTSVNAAGMRHSFYCPSDCFSEKRLGVSNDSSSVTIFREVLHMHKSGQRMTNIHIDVNGSITRVSEANRFDFSQGAGYASRADLPYQLNPGDSFVTTCYFSKRGILWGSSSSEEMCQSFLWYYPKRENVMSLSCSYFDPTARALSTGSENTISSIDAVGCEMSYDRREVDARSDLERISDQQCQKFGVSQRSDRYGALTLGTSNWPSLLQLVNAWGESSYNGQNLTSTAKKRNSSTSYSNNAELLSANCTLCRNRSRPTKPDLIIEGFSWSCDELDAAVPVLFSRPDLLMFAAKDVPSCADYQNGFGDMCGCDDELSADSSTMVVGSKWKEIIANKVRHDVGTSIAAAGALFVATTLLVCRRRCSIRGGV